MEVLLQNIAALAWLALAVLTFIRLRQWNKSLGEMIENMKREFEEEKEPVVHGRWIKHQSGVDCSECGVPGSHHWPLCPNCGAEMERYHAED